MRVKTFLKRHLFIVILTSIFVLLCLSLLGWFKYVINPDALSYFTIAREYAEGNFKDAINGYWGPLLSILLVPAVWLNVDLIIASKILIIFTSAILLILIYAFLIKKGVAKRVTYIALSVVALLLLPWGTYEGITPDILLTLLLFVFLVCLLRFLDNPVRRNIIIVAVIGALLYFTKGFGFFLFIGVIGVLALRSTYLHRDNLRKTLKPFFLVLALFFVLTAPFITVISIKNHHPTISTAGEYIHRFMGPEQASVYPNTYLGPLTPETDKALSAWETPDVYTESMPDWGIFDSRHTLFFFLNSILLKNISTTIQALYSFGPLVILGVFCLGIGFLAKRKDYKSEYLVITILFVFTIGGYAILFTEARYILIAGILAIVAASFALSQLFQKKVLTNVQLTVIAAIAVIPLLITVSQTILISKDGAVKHYEAAQYTASIIPKGANIISNDFDSYKICYFNNQRCYNVLNPSGKTATEYVNLLKSLDVFYYVDYNLTPRNLVIDAFVAEHYVRVGQHNGDTPVTVYRLKD